MTTGMTKQEVLELLGFKRKDDNKMELKVKTEFCEYRNCYLMINNYRADNSIYIELVNDEDGPIATLTTCLNDWFIGENETYLDTNNCPWVEKFMKKYKLGKPTGHKRRSGWCEYPLYELNITELNKYIREGEF